jgi:hypothetical protein
MEWVCDIRPDIIPNRSSLKETYADITPGRNDHDVLNRAEPCLETLVATRFHDRLDAKQSEMNRNCELVMPPDFLSNGGVQLDGSNRVLTADLDVVDTRWNVHHGGLGAAR